MKHTFLKQLIYTLLLLGIHSTESIAQCNDTTFLHVSTGISTTGTTLPTSGVIDPYWQLTNLPPLATNFETGFAVPNTYTIPTGAAASFGPAWCNIPGIVGLNVIPNTLFNDNNLNANQPWRFIRKFSVTGSGLVHFYGSFIGDDLAELSVYSNTGTQYFNSSGLGHSAMKQFDDTLQLSAGCYYLEIKLLNVGAYAMGFAVNAMLSSSNNILANPTNLCCGGSIVSGQKWIDKDCNQEINSTDIPGSGWTFNLLNGSTIIQTTTTNSLGEFYFNNVPNGNYTVKEVNQTGYTASVPSTGSYAININNQDSVISLIFLNCQDTIPNSSCAQIIDPLITCKDGQYELSFSLKNLTAWDMKGLTIRNLDPNITAVSSMQNGGEPFFDIPDVYAGTSSGSITVPLYVPVYTNNACFNFTFCTSNTPNLPTLNCCTIDSICMDVPLCPDDTSIGTLCKNPCDGMTELTYEYADSTESCCFNISFQNDYIAANIGTITFDGIGGTEFSVTSTNGWGYTGTNTATHREIKAPVGGVGVGLYANFMNMCITDTNQAPHKVVVHYIDVNGICMCADTLIFEKCTVVPPHCATIVNDSIYCKNNKTYLQFDITNNAAFPIMQLDYFISDTSHFVVSPTLIQFTTPLAVGTTTGPYFVEIDTINGGAHQFCFQVSGHDSAYTANSYATNCCSDAIRQVCLPFLDCKKGGCCEFEEMIIPNGITPNADGFNDLWILQKPTHCENIKITVLNRWGNVVYKDANYLNNWGGTNQSGQLLPQSTYFVVIELKNGSKKGLYVDVRY